MASTCGASSDGLGRAGGRGRRGGVAAAAAAHFTVVPGWGSFAAILALGVLDATLGYVAGVTFVGAAALAGHLVGANEVRLAMGVVLVWFAVPLGAASVTTLRRRLSTRTEDVADRFGDLLVGGLFGAWLAVKMTAALSVLAGVDLPLSHDGARVVEVVLVTLSARIVLETWAAHGERLAAMTHRGELASSRAQIAISLTVQMAAFWFVSAGSLGASWTLGIGEGVFFAPLVAWLWVDQMPKSAWLGRHAARGVAKWSFVIASGTALAILLGHGSASVQLGFVLLPLPILAFWTLELFEGEGAPAAAQTWRRRVAGFGARGSLRGTGAEHLGHQGPQFEIVRRVGRPRGPSRSRLRRARTVTRRTRRRARTVANIPSAT